MMPKVGDVVTIVTEDMVPRKVTVVEADESRFTVNWFDGTDLKSFIVTRRAYEAYLGLGQ